MRHILVGRVITEIVSGIHHQLSAVKHSFPIFQQSALEEMNFETRTQDAIKCGPISNISLMNTVSVSQY